MTRDDDAPIRGSVSSSVVHVRPHPLVARAHRVARDRRRDIPRPRQDPKVDLCLGALLDPYLTDAERIAVAIVTLDLAAAERRYLTTLSGGLPTPARG